MLKGLDVDLLKGKVSRPQIVRDHIGHTALPVVVVPKEYSEYYFLKGKVAFQKMTLVRW